MKLEEAIDLIGGLLSSVMEEDLDNCRTVEHLKETQEWILDVKEAWMIVKQEALK